MTEPAPARPDSELPASASEEAKPAAPIERPPTRHSRTYGRVPVDEAASGRRARLRHPARGGVRH
jgi:hypothetical protein